MTNFKIKFKRVALFFSDIKPIVLSHHPNCEHFYDHVYHIGKYRLCIGCFTYYPTIILTIIFSILFIDMSVQNLIILYFLSFLFFLAILLNIIHLTKFKILKILSKVSIGIGTGFYIVAVIYLPIFLILKILSLFLVNFYTGVIAYVRANHITKECEQCEYKGHWEVCPGMKPIIENLYEHGFKKKKIKIISEK
ncbi:hypothetical protein ES706_03250 [subsurface metagenome]